MEGGRVHEKKMDIEILRSCVQFILKIFNSVIGMVGLGMVVYSIWLVRVWNSQMGHSLFDDPTPLAPWFIYIFLGLGVAFCMVTCLCHLAADTAHCCCVSLYMLVIFLILMLEAGMTADVFLNPNWEEDFPEDPSGDFKALEDFIRSNFKFCRWIGLSIVFGFCFLVAMVLKALGPNQYFCDSVDDDYILERVVNGTPRYAGRSPAIGSRDDAYWSVPIYEN